MGAGATGGQGKEEASTATDLARQCLLNTSEGFEGLISEGYECLGKWVICRRSGEVQRGGGAAGTRSAERESLRAQGAPSTGRLFEPYGAPLGM